jgi:hypothetical protein
MERFCRVDFSEAGARRANGGLLAGYLPWIWAAILKETVWILSITAQLIARTALCRPLTSELDREALGERHQLIMLFGDEFTDDPRFTGSPQGLGGGIRVLWRFSAKLAILLHLKQPCWLQSHSDS